MTIDQFFDIEKFIWCFTVSVYKTLFRLGEVVTSLYKISHTTYSDMPRGVIKASDFAHSSHFHFVIHYSCSMCLRFHIIDKISFQLFVPQDMYRNTSRFSVSLALNILLSALTTSRCVEDLQKHLNAHLSCLIIKCPVIFLSPFNLKTKAKSVKYPILSMPQSR